MHEGNEDASDDSGPHPIRLQDIDPIDSDPDHNDDSYPRFVRQEEERRRLLLELQIRRTHFVTYDGPEIPRRRIAELHSRVGGVLRYATWAREISPETGHMHWHMYVELVEPRNALWLRAALFPDGDDGGDRNVFIEPIHTNRYAARNYVQKRVAQRVPGDPAWHEYGYWVEPQRPPGIPRNVRLRGSDAPIGRSPQLIDS